MTFESKLMHLFDERQKLVQEHSDKIGTLCSSGIEGIKAFLKNSGDLQEGCDLVMHHIYRVPNSEEIMFIGTVTYPVGMTVVDEDGDEMEVTDEVSEYFNFPFQFWVPIRVLAEASTRKVYDYLTEVEGVIDEQTAQLKEVVDSLFGHPEVFETDANEEEDFNMQDLSTEQKGRMFDLQKKKKGGRLN